MKNSFSLLEIILTLIISSIVILYSTLYTKELFFTNKDNQYLEIAKVDIQSTKIFLQKHRNELDFLSYENENLYFKDNLLLENVKNFTLEKNTQNIKISINFDDLINQTWEFKL
ncbi:MAG: hypothetical protein KA055_00950 [Aliarcobacter sp.]|nr:hypothetical protein [Aliarcobacter sp.]